jgi:deoxyribodipyrimidine photo-lyase
MPTALAPSRSRVPDDRVRVMVDAPVNPAGKYVLYWMTAARRTRSSFALERAVEWSRELGKPLLVLEGLRAGYQWAADRHHVFVLQGMAEQRRRFEAAGVRYLAYVEPEPGAGSGLLAALAEHASIVVGDDSPVFFLPRMLAAAARRLSVRFEAIDGHGILPLSASDRAFPTAHAFRRHLQKVLPRHVDAMPRPDPLARLDRGAKATVPANVRSRWAFASARDLDRPAELAASLPIDHEPAPVPFAGGEAEGRALAKRFVDDRLAAYENDRNHPDADATSNLSPYLHFGHVSPHEVLALVAASCDWTPDRLNEPVGGARHGFWGMPTTAEAFLDQLVTWRELGATFCRHRDDVLAFESLPGWAKTTIAEHAGDRRPALYELHELEAARTHDPIWNAAQRQLLVEGRIHNYLRMLWGKLVYTWTPDARTALFTLVALNDRWAIDGRDPNSYSGIFWVFGRYDRAWGPERPVFGKLRAMTSASAARKLHLREYLARWSA